MCASVAKGTWNPRFIHKKSEDPLSLSAPVKIVLLISFTWGSGGRDCVIVVVVIMVVISVVCLP